MSKRKKIVVLISGSGSNLQAIIDATQANDFPGEIAAVISNRGEAYGLERAKNFGIPTQVLNHKEFEHRESFDQALCNLIDEYQPQLVVLAGFMRILTEDFVNHFLGRLINIHPSLLPKYPGLHTHKRALEAGDKEHGATVHFVTAELDGGPAILQARVPIQLGDNEDKLAERVLGKEHVIYPLAVSWFCNGAVQYQNGQAIFDGEPLPASGVDLEAWQATN